MHRAILWFSFHAGVGGGMADPYSGTQGLGGSPQWPPTGMQGSGRLAGIMSVQATTPVAPTVTYSDSVRPILVKDCYRCHNGPMRNMATYDAVKGYADNGLLLMMTQPGGPMSRFLSASEYHTLTSWVKNGSPP